MSTNKCLCIHGHFYQPPRENPWLEYVEPQRSAAPFHDWNERIHSECYLPNCKARVFDSGKILDIVNNYESISFNFGPSLMSWMVENHPGTYRKILEADLISRKEHRGHGNAIAQVYNHMIMPLANERDKVTQVRWGVEEFKIRYGRSPEGIWLPETACDRATLEVLIQEGILFTILAPHQAQAVREIGSQEWRKIHIGSIDPRQPYRFYSEKEKNKFIDLFFYDGPISRDISFTDVTRDAKMLADRIQSVFDYSNSSYQLMHLATDGETFGHHKHFADRALAYLTHIEAQSRGLRIVNYGEFLAENPPRYEVQLYEGDEGLGASWSCAHGIKRWKEHCGCRGGGPGEWNQYWRRPLRDALDYLRDHCAEIFDRIGAVYFHDAWAARDGYIEVILNRSPGNIRAFMEKHLKVPVTDNTTVTCLKLLEMQRHAMLMYTSCGWFFTELSGIETVQIIQYAARVVQLAQELTGQSCEENFLEKLSQARSNLSKLRDGRGIYEKMIRPAMVSPAHLVSCHAICAMFDECMPTEGKIEHYCYDMNVLHQRREQVGDLSIHFGHMRIISIITREQHDYVFVVVRFGQYDFHSSVKVVESDGEVKSIENELFENIESTHIVELLRKIDASFGETYYSLKDLPIEERMKIISLLTKEVVDAICVQQERLYDENKKVNELFHSVGLPLPDEIKFAAAHTLMKRLNSAMQSLADNGFNLQKAAPIYRIIEMAKAFDVKLKKNHVADFLNRELEKRTEKLIGHLSPELLLECMHILKIAERINATLTLESSQDHLFSVLEMAEENPHILNALRPEVKNHLMNLLSLLHISSKRVKAVH